MTSAGPTPIPTGGAVLVARGRRVDPSAHGRSPGGAAGRGQALALARLERSRERDRRRAAARQERQAVLPRRRGVPLAATQRPPGARSGRPARRRPHRPGRRGGDEAAPTASACRTTSSRSSSPASARRPRSVSARDRQPGSRSTGRCSRGRRPDSRRRSPTRSSTRTAASTWRLRRRHVLSPNGDGAGDTESFSYRVARPSHVIATLKGPGGATITLADDSESAGLHVLGWNGKVQGSPARRGQVDAHGHGNRRPHDHDERAANVRARRHALVTRPRAASSIAESDLPAHAGGEGRHPDPATERRAGRRLSARGSGRQGPEHASWRGRIDGHPAPAGRYQLVVQATSPVGTSSLAAPFSLSAH